MEQNPETQEQNQSYVSENETKAEQLSRIANLLIFFFFILLGLSLVYPLSAFKSLGSYIQLGFVAVIVFTTAVIFTQKITLTWFEKVALALGFVVSIYLAWATTFLEYKPIVWEKISETIPGLIGFFASFTLYKVIQVIKPNAQKIIPLVLLAFLVLLSAHGLYQVFGPAGLPGTFASSTQAILENSDLYSPQELDGLLHALQSGRATGRIGTPNIFAGLLILGLPVCSFLLLKSDQQNKKEKIFGGIALLILLIGIYSSASRGALLVTVAFAVISIPAFIYLKKKRIPQHAAALLISLILATPAFAQTLSERLTNVSTIQQRLYYWEAGLEIFKLRPIFGNGPGAFEYYYKTFRTIGSQETRLAHSWLVEWAVEFGILGLLLITGWILFSIFSGFKTSKSGDDPNCFLQKITLSTAVIMGLLHGLVEYTFSFGTFFLFWSVLLGFVATQPVSTVQEQKKNQPVVIGVLSCFVILSAILWLNSSYKMGVVDNHLRTSEDYIYLSKMLEAEAELDEAIEIQPNNDEIYLQRAYIFEVTGQIDKALDDLIKAKELNPQSANIHERIALYHQRRGDLEEAIKHQEKAIELHPLDGRHRVIAANMYLDSGQNEKAEQVIEILPQLHMTPVEKKQYDELLRQM